MRYFFLKSHDYPYGLEILKTREQYTFESHEDRVEFIRLVLGRTAIPA
jgi:hypothetical protein